MEIRYLLKHKLILIIIFAVIVNILVFYKSILDSESNFYDDNGFTYDEYSETYDGYIALATSLQNEELDSIIAELKKHYINNVTDSTKDVHKYACQKAISYTNYILNYSDLINTAISQTDIKLQSNLYNKCDFGYYNLLKGKYDISKLESLKLNIVNYQAEEKVYNYHLSQIFSLFIMLFVVCIFQYSKKGFTTIVKSTRKGRFILAIKRCGVLVLLSVIINILLYFPILFISFKRYGGAEYLNSLIQTSEAFTYVPYVVTFKNLFLIIILFNVISSLVCAFVFWLFVKLFSDRTTALAFISMFMFAEYILYIIPYNHIIPEFFKNSNIINYINLFDVFISYDNWGIAPYLITDFTLSLVGLSVTLFILIVVNIILSTILWNGIDIKSKSLDKIREIIKNKFSYFSITVKEYKKIICFQKVGVVIIILFFITLNYSFGSAGIIDESEFELQDYYSYVQGDPYEKTDEYLSNINIWIANAEQSLTMYTEKSDAITVLEINKSIEQKKALLNTIVERSDKIRRLNETGISNAKIVNTETLSRRYGSRTIVYSSNISFLLFLFIVLSYSKSFMLERSNNTTSIIRTTKHGRIEFIVKKISLELVVSQFVVVALFIIQYLRVNIAFPMQSYELNASIQSIDLFDNSKLSITFLQLEFICLALRVLIVGIVCIIIAAMSLLYDETVLYIGSILAITPYIFECIGFRFLKSLSLIDYIAFYGKILDSNILLHYLILFIILLLLMGYALIRGLRKWKMC